MASMDPMSPHILRNVIDVCIVGAGPAGLSAALTLGRVVRSVVVLDTGVHRYGALSEAHLPGDNDEAALIRSGMRAEVQRKYKTITFAKAGAKNIRKIGPIFEVEDDTGRLWKGRKVILATGCKTVAPSIPGYTESWGRGIFDCLHRRGFEHFGVSSAAVLVTPSSKSWLPDAMSHARLAKQFSTKVSILTNGLEASNEILEAAESQNFRIEKREIRRLKTVGYGDDSSMAVEFEDGSTSSFGFLFHKPETIFSGDFAAQLGLQSTESGEILISGTMQETSERGVFAAGDCASPVKQVSVAMGAGSVARVGANAQILQDDYEQPW
ncbi:hypothetical protein CkaCkLH20_11291 [Colletotrichum karsti]|uniref:FAD/NAD(P)-binding domain-containing protein n=1 Tax=Colletotrichum karsti TaxID=1095194 RepID=A0A9P6HU84_9PEZI|nr:uncharacterized protein CkaCkLH20_11291 [Colletotrichum karsti]KAF9871122.1 hypothetical protein CkaCkLH20_11291 [Colletotrichum karsti]